VYASRHEKHPGNCRRSTNPTHPAALPKELGRTRRVLADSGYLSQSNVEQRAAARIGHADAEDGAWGGARGRSRIGKRTAA